MLYVANIEVVEEEVDVFDITVETDESFICAGAVLHNCPTCSQIGGLRFAVDAKDISVLPVHPRCRCCYIPVTVLSDMSEVTRPAANADFMAEAKRAYEAKHPEKDWEALAESSKNRYYHQAIHAYEERTGKPAFRQVPGAHGGDRPPARGYQAHRCGGAPETHWLSQRQYPGHVLLSVLHSQAHLGPSGAGAGMDGCARFTPAHAVVSRYADECGARRGAAVSQHGPLQVG